MAYLSLRDSVSPWFRRVVGRLGHSWPILVATGLSLGLTLGLFVLMHRWERQEQQAELGRQLRGPHRRGNAVLDHVVIGSGGYASLRDRGVTFDRSGAR